MQVQNERWMVQHDLYEHEIAEANRCLDEAQAILEERQRHIVRAAGHFVLMEALLNE